MPTLSAYALKSQSIEILNRYKKEPSIQLRNRLTQVNMGLVRKEAHRYKRLTEENFDDLMQVGTLGLIKAIERFDLKKGTTFSTFATPFISGEIRHYLRDKSTTVRIPRRWHELQGQVSKVVLDLQEQLERPPSDKEVASKLKISVEELQQVKMANSNRSVLSLDGSRKEGDSEFSSLMDLLPDPSYQSFQLVQEDRQQLQEALSQLETLTQEILKFIFLQGLTKKETAERLGVSSMTVSRRAKIGLNNLRVIMKPTQKSKSI